MKTRPLVFVIFLGLCVQMLDCKLIVGNRKPVYSVEPLKQTNTDSDLGSGSDTDDIGSSEYPVEDPGVDDSDTDVDLGSADVELPMTTCQMLYNKIQRDSKGIIGGYVPQCTPNGQFTPVQCHSSSGQCWCVDSNGRQITGTMRPSFHKPDCTGVDQQVPWSRLPNVNRPPPVSTRTPVIDDGIVIDHTTPSPDSDNGVNIFRDDEDNDVEYGENRVAFASRGGLLNHPGILAAIIGGGVLVLLCIILLLMFIIYRMRKKDEGSYALEEPKKKLTSSPGKDTHSTSIVYTKAAANDREFYA
jgi:hypothetical protein